MYEWLMGVEYDVYYDVVYFLLYLNCESDMKLLNYLVMLLVFIYVYVHICCWWVFLHVGEIVGKCMYIYSRWKLPLIIAVEIVVEYSRWIVVNICIVDWVICSCIICWVGCLHPYCRWPDTCIHIAVVNDVQLASWGDDLGGDLVPHSYRCRV